MDTPTRNPTLCQLAAEGLRFGYDRTPVVDGVSFRAQPGELVAIVGPNGCGKSTLLKLLLGVLQPAAGRVTIDGKALADYGRVGMARRVALVPHMGGPDATGAMGAGLGGGFTVLQSVLQARYAAHVDEERTGLLQAAGGLGIFGFETPADQRKARQAMWSQDVHYLVERDLESLSGGERQRVAIARALAQETPVLLLDEPTSALDLYHQLELMAHLGALVRGELDSEDALGTRRLVVLVTHDLNLALACATRVLVMDRGRIVADGTPSNVLTPEVLEGVYHVRVRTEGGGLRFERMTRP